MNSPDEYETLAAALRKRFESDPWWRFLGIEVEHVAGGSSRLRLHVSDGVRRPTSGAMREGVLACLVEAAVGAAIDSLNIPGLRNRTTVNLTMSFLSLATHDVVAEASVTLSGDEAARGEAEVRDLSGELVASGVVVCAASSPLEDVTGPIP